VCQVLDRETERKDSDRDRGREGERRSV